MNILLITRRFPPAPGGVETQVSQIAYRLAKRGHRVRVHTSDLYSDIPLRRLPRGYDHDTRGIEISRHMGVPVPRRMSKGTSFAPTMLLAVLKMNSPDIVHCQGFNLLTVSASFLMQGVRKCKVICTPHVDPSLLAGNLSVIFVRRFNGLVALTKIERKRMLELGVDRSKIRMIPNGVDLDEFNDLPTRDYFRRENGIANHLILYAGRIDTLKGCAVLIEAVSLVQRRIGDCTLVFAGPDWGSTEYLRELSDRRKVPTIFTGNLSSRELRSALVACDVFVLPSFSESFPISILEAMIAGAPVVATRVGGVPALVHDQDTGLLVSPGDHEGLAEAICRILEDPQLSTSLATNAKASAGKYTIERTVNELESFYTEILGES
jgi:glycosyltransferase involved in cell wall biosynthesis